MPDLTALFTVDAPIDKAWEFLKDPDNIGRCIRGVTVRTIDADTHVWSMTGKVGFISKTIELKTKVTVRDDVQHHGEFNGSGSGILAAGTVDLREDDPGRTVVSVVLVIQASGLAGPAIEKMIASREEDFRRRLIENVKAELERP
jgi:carbon monoxide dehydrogenase subunit G